MYVKITDLIPSVSILPNTEDVKETSSTSNKSGNDTGVHSLSSTNMGLRSKSGTDVMELTLYDNVFLLTDKDNSGDSTNRKASSQQCKVRKISVPSPSKKMKPLPWVKLPDSCVGK